MSNSREQGGAQPFHEGYLDWKSIAAMLFVFATTKAFLAFPNQISAHGQTAAWSVPLFSAALSLVWLWPLVYVLRQHPGKSILEITESLAGRPVSFVLGTVLYVYGVGIVATEAREIGEALGTVILPLTPMTFTMVSLFATGLFVALKGTEVVGRMALLAAVAVVVHVVTLAVLALPKWGYDSFFPILGPGVPQLLKVYGVQQAAYGEFVFLGLLAPFLRRKSNLGKAARWSLLPAALILTVTVVSSELTFPYPSLAVIPAPFLRVIRLIYLSRFIQRFDALFVILWLSAGSLTIAIGSSVLSQIVGTITPIRSYPAAVVLTTVLSLAGALAIDSFSQTIILEFDVIRPYSAAIFIGWPLLLLILQLVRKKKPKPEADFSDQAGI